MISEHLININTSFLPNQRALQSWIATDLYTPFVHYNIYLESYAVL